MLCMNSGVWSHLLIWQCYSATLKHQSNSLYLSAATAPPLVSLWASFASTRLTCTGFLGLEFVCWKPTYINRGVHFSAVAPVGRCTRTAIQLCTQRYTSASFKEESAEEENHAHTHMNTCTRNKGCVLQLQPSQIPDTVFPLHRTARIRALVCSSPAGSHWGSLLSVHTQTRTPTHTRTQWHANVCGASCWLWSRCGHDCLAVFV